MTDSNPTFTFSSGLTVGIKRVSPLLMLALRRENPEPTPPMQEVTYGDDKKVLEANPADPKYIADLKAYEQAMEEKYRRLIILRGVNYVLNEDQKNEVRELRNFWLESYGKTLSGSDFEVFIAYLAIQSDSDFTNLFNAVTSRSQPTEAVVSDHLDNFRS